MAFGFNQFRISFVLLAIILYASLYVGENSVFNAIRDRGGEGRGTYRGEQQSMFAALKAENFSKEYAVWADRIGEIGAQHAYGEFLSANQQGLLGLQHTRAHLFGRILYDTAGIAGISVCDREFSYGCYHGFLEVAVVHRGLEALPLLDDACKERFGSFFLPCQHGIGHAMLAYMGHNKLIEALYACATITWQPIGGCASGVFMEYNLPIASTSNIITIREPDVGDMFAPCTQVPEKFRKACYFEQPNWWERVFAGNYTMIGELCGKIKEEEFRESCFRGAGNHSVRFTKFNVEDIITFCSTMPSSAASLLCRKGAMRIFLSSWEHRTEAHLFCGGLPKGEEAVCREELQALQSSSPN